MPDRWHFWTPDDRDRSGIVEAATERGAVLAACEQLSEWTLDHGTTIHLQRLDESAPRFDVGHDVIDIHRWLTIDGKRVDHA